MTEAKSCILVADDEANIRKTLSLVLESAGHTVDVARDGDEALELCKQNHPDIAFLDLRMPKTDGLEALAQMRALSPKTSVVIITAYGTAANAVEAMKLGAVDFVEKPFDPKMVGVLAEEILFRKQMASGGSFDDLMHLADLARERKAHFEARAYLKAAMARAFDRAEPYYWLGHLSEEEGDERRAVQYYYMAVSADRTYQPSVDALKRLGKIH
jgi:DNA-binding NtrC family response regulator